MKLPEGYATFLKKIRHYDVGDLAELVDRFSSADQLVDARHPFGKSQPASFIRDDTQKKYLYGSSGLGRIIDRPVTLFWMVDWILAPASGTRKI